MLVSRNDAIALAVAIGYKTAAKWNRQRMTTKIAEIATRAREDGLEVDDECEDAERLNALLAEMTEADEFEVVAGDAKVEEPKEKKAPAKKPAKSKKVVEPEPELEEEDEEEDDEDQDDEEDEPEVDVDEPDDEETEDEEDEIVPVKKKTTKVAKGSNGKAPKAKASKGGNETCFSVAMDLLTKKPDMEFADLQKALEKKGLFKLTSARTAMSSVRAVVAGLRKNGLLK